MPSDRTLSVACGACEPSLTFRSRARQALSHISETVEMQMGVQRKWMYLESIFVGSEDIRKQVINDDVAIRS